MTGTILISIPYNFHIIHVENSYNSDMIDTWFIPILIPCNFHVTLNSHIIPIWLTHNCTRHRQLGVSVSGKFERSSNFINILKSHPNLIQRKRRNLFWVFSKVRFYFYILHFNFTREAENITSTRIVIFYLKKYIRKRKCIVRDVSIFLIHWVVYANVIIHLSVG